LAIYSEVRSRSIFDIKTRKWLIAPEYSSVNQVGNYFLALKNLDQNGLFLSSSSFGHVDVFENRGKTIRFVKQIKSTGAAMDLGFLVKEAFKADQIDRLPGSNELYKVRKENKEKVVKLTISTDLNFTDFLPNQWCDLVIYHWQFNKMFAYDQGKIYQYELDIEQQKMVLEYTNVHFASLSLMEETLYYGNKTESNRNITVLSMEQIGDLIIVHQHLPEIQAFSPLHTAYGEDSVSNEGYFVYPSPEPGLYLSGVYDLNTKKWVIPQSSRFVIPIGKNFLTQHYELDKQGLIANNKMIQTFYNSQGEKIVDHHVIESLDRDTFVKKLFPNYQVEFANVQSMPFEMLMDENVQAQMVYKITAAGKQNFVRMDFEKGNFLNHAKILVPKNADFVDGSYDFNNRLEHPTNYLILYNNDTLKLYFSPFLGEEQLIYSDSISFFAPNFELHLLVHKNSFSIDDNQKVFHLIALKVDTQNFKYFAFQETASNVKIKPISEQEFKLYQEKFVFKKQLFKREGNVLLLQKNPFFQENQSDYFNSNDDSILSHEYSFSVGNSGVYKKTDTGWMNLVGPFSELKNTKYGFIGVENYTEQRIQLQVFFDVYVPVDSDSLNARLRKKEYMCQLLNKDFKPFEWTKQSRFFAIEDLVFGYRIFTSEQESILISSSGEIICEEHHDEYFLENGKIIGFNRELYDYNDDGDFIVDDKGNPIVTRKEKRSVFEMKP
jgi:hypothetical protein